MRERNDAGCHRCRRSARRTTGRISKVPRISRGAVELRLGERQEAEFRHVGFAKSDEARRFKAGHQCRVKERGCRWQKREPRRLGQTFLSPRMSFNSIGTPAKAPESF